MTKVELTPAKLAKLRQKAEGCDPKHWVMDQHGDVVAVDFDNKGSKLKIASVDYLEDAEHIADADPATVLAMVEEIETLKTALNLLMSEYYSTDLEHEDIDKLCIGQIEIAKKHRKSEATQ